MKDTEGELGRGVDACCRYVIQCTSDMCLQREIYLCGPRLTDPHIPAPQGQSRSVTHGIVCRESEVNVSRM